LITGPLRLLHDGSNRVPHRDAHRGSSFGDNGVGLVEDPADGFFIGRRRITGPAIA
jgi:hypothetical protein